MRSMSTNPSTRTGIALSIEVDVMSSSPRNRQNANGDRKVVESRQGSVQLRSGRWSWLIREQVTGASVVFHHRDRPLDELRTWIPESELSVARATELALDPVERIWQDGDGILWTIRTEFPADWARDAGDGSRMIRLAFTYHGLRKAFPVSADTRLGDLTHSELARLFDGSS